MENTSIINLRKRFVSDFNIPIQIFHNPYFSERLEILNVDFSAKNMYNRLIKDISDNFDCDEEAFLTMYAEVRENIIQKTKSSKAYNDFLNVNVDDFKFEPLPVGNVKLYTEEQADEEDNMFVSFDLKHANFQALRWFNSDIFEGCKTYSDYVHTFTNSDYISSSKYTRQVIFGQLNPKRTILIEKLLVSKLYHYLKEAYPFWGEPFSINNDEIIYKLSKKHFDQYDFQNARNISDNILSDLNISVHIDKFRLHMHKFIRECSKSPLLTFEKCSAFNYSGLKKDLHCVPCIYAPQVYKLIHSQPITDNDLVFYHEHELSKFMYPLTLDYEQESKIKYEKFDELPF